MQKLFIAKFLICLFVGVLCPLLAYAQTAQDDSIDPRLIQIVDIVEKRVSNLNTDKSGGLRPASFITNQSDERVDAVEKLSASFFSVSSEKIRENIAALEAVNGNDPAPHLSNVIRMYKEYADTLDEGLTREQKIERIKPYQETNNWLEAFYAEDILVNLHVEAGQRQAALQAAQRGMTAIPKTPNADENIYAQSAMAQNIIKVSYLHALQGNVNLALDAVLAFLKQPESRQRPEAMNDFINNLMYAYLSIRDSDSQIYLSKRALNFEHEMESSIQGMIEFRAAQAMNLAGRFEEGLEYTNLALAELNHPSLTEQAQVNKAVSLAGLGRKAEARALAKKVGANLSPEYLLETELRHFPLYLGYLLAKGEDEDLALQLYLRQLDATTEKFFANNSRDTTSMLAELENSRERQIEREKAAAREAELQAITIKRQQNLNRVLLLLLLILSGVAIASFLFMRSREKLLRKLEIKTVEAASAEKLKTEFLGMISHELRTPLNGIIGISDFLANYHEDEDIRKKTEIILRSGNELLAVVESLTDMARLDAGQLALVPYDADLSLSLPTVAQAWSPKAAEKGLAFTHFIDPALSEYNLDEDRLIQCLNILMANAISFTDAGRVHMHITGHENAEGDIESLTAIVADTGQGMSEVVQSRLFTPFMQADTSRKRNHMGTGLSLAIAYALAKMMGGNLSVVSREGRGSEFKLFIPLAAPKHEFGLPQDAQTPSADIPPVLETPVLDGPDAPQREIVDLMQPRAGFPSLHEVDELVLPTPEEGPQRILVVDDVESNRDILRLILESQGHICSEAADGQSALNMLSQKPFDVIVLDIHMSPMDGVEMLQRLRASGQPYSNIPVVALTADNAASTNAACMEAGADLFLTKPARQNELLGAIRFLNQSEGARILSQ